MEDDNIHEYDFTAIPPTREKQESLLIEKFQFALNDLAKRNYEEGIQSLKELLESDLVIEELHDLRHQCYFNLAVVHEEKKYTREALLYYYKCVSMRENDFNTWLKLSNYCMRLHYFEQAEHCYQNCIKYIPTSFYETLLYEKMVYTAFLMKNYNVCQQRIDFLLPKNYKKAELLLLKAIISREKGNIHEYEKLKNEALQIDPTVNENELIVLQIAQSQAEDLPPLLSAPKSVEEEKASFKEITITIDKYSWDIFLKKLKNILKTCYLLSENLTISKKLRKNNPIKSILANESENYQTVMSSLFRIRDKKEKEKGTPKHLKVTPENKGNDTPSVNQDDHVEEAEPMVIEKKPESDFILREDSNSAPKPFIIVREDKKKKRPSKPMPKEDVKDDLPAHRPEKVSARIQNLKTQQLYSNISLEYILSNYTFKNDLKFDDLIDMYKDDFLHFNDIKSDEDILNLHPPVQMIEEYDGINSMLMMFSQDVKSTVIDADKLKEKLGRASNEDFLKFLRDNHNKKFANVVLFARHVLEHFLKNTRRDLPKDLNDIPIYLEARASLAFCPSYHLTDYKKKMVIKIYLDCYHFCENIITDYSSKLTLFELLVDFYQFKTSIPVKEANVDKHNELMRRLKSAMGYLSQSLLFEKLELTDREQVDTNLSLLQVRSILVFARFFLTEDFKCTTSARECLQLLVQELRRLDNWMEVNTQMIENNIYVNMFWMKDKLLMGEQVEILEGKLKENELKDNAYVHQNDEKEADSEEKLAYLEGLFKIFEEKVKVSLDSAVEAHYKKVYQKVSSLHCGDFVFYLDKLFRILLEILWQSNENEDSRKVLVHAYQQLKIKELLGIFEAHLDKHKKIKKLMDRDQVFTHKIANLANYLYRMIVINNVMDYMLDFEIFLGLFFKTGQILVRKLGGREPVISQLKFFRLYHWLLHLVPSDRATKYHLDLAKSSYRQDTTLKALHYVKENYGSYSADDKEDKKRNDDEDEEESIKDIMESEILEIFACWYGIGTPSDIEVKENLQGIKNFKDIIILQKYIEYFYPEYSQDPTMRFKVVISRALQDIYDYLKDHQEDWWDLCEGFKKRKQRFDRLLIGKGPEVDFSIMAADDIEKNIDAVAKDFEEAMEETQREAMEIEEAASEAPMILTQFVPEQTQTQTQIVLAEEKTDKVEKIEEEIPSIDMETDDCFCEKKTCFRNHFKHLGKEAKETFAQVFYYIGKALDDTKPSTEGSDGVKQRKILLRIEKMYAISSSFFPDDPYICNALASTLIDQYILYSDQLVYDKVYDKFMEFEECQHKAKNILTSLIEMMDNNKHSLFFKNLKTEDVYARVLSNVKTTKLLELFELKFKLHLGYSHADNDLKENIRAKIETIRDELKVYPINPAYIKDFYLTGTMIMSSVPKQCSYKEHQEVMTRLVELCDLVETSSTSLATTPFDKNLLSLYELETETHLFVMMYKIFRRYMNILKFVYDPNFAKELEQKLQQGPSSFEKLKKYLLYDFNEFMKYLEREKKIKFEFKRMIMEGKTSVDRAAISEEITTNKSLLELVSDDQNEVTNFSGFLVNFIADTAQYSDKDRQKISKDIDYMVNNCGEIQGEELTLGEVLKSAEAYMTGIAKKLREIPQKKDAKKYRGSPFHVKCQLFSSKIFEEYFKDYKKALEIVAQLFVGKCNEVVEIYKYEKDNALALVYNRDLHFLRSKHKVIKSYTRLSYKVNTKESYEKCKFLHKKAYGLVLIPDKEKKNEKICLLYLRLYEITLEYILEYLTRNIDRIDQEFGGKRDLMQEENADKSGEAQDNAISDAYKNELKIIYEMITNNIRSRNVSPIMKKNDHLYRKLCDLIILYYERLAPRCGVEVKDEKKFEASLGFFDQLFKKKRTGKKDDKKGEEEGAAEGA